MRDIKRKLLLSTYMNEYIYKHKQVDPDFSKCMFEYVTLEDFKEITEIWRVGSELEKLVKSLTKLVCNTMVNNIEE